MVIRSWLTLQLVLIWSVSCTLGQEVHRCRLAPAKKYGRSFESQADADGFVRSTGNCWNVGGHQCDLCCNGMCCEVVDDHKNPRFGRNQQIWIPIRFAIVVGSKEVSPVKPQHLTYQMSRLNSAYSGTGFFFTMDSVEVFYDDKMKDSCNTDPCYVSEDCDFFQYTLPKVALDSARVLNVVLCELRSYYGEAQFPWTVPESHPQQYVEVGFNSFSNMAKKMLGMTLVHEAGHYLGLLHTFGEWGTCDNPGDYVADTPISSEAASETQPCTTKLDSCPKAKGLDPFSNYMNYAADACMTSFTKGQIARMQFAVQKYRPKLVSNYRVNGSCPSTATSLANCTCENGLSPLDYCGNRLLPFSSTLYSSGALPHQLLLAVVLFLCWILAF
jgi:hypothetical protein